MKKVFLKTFIFLSLASFLSPKSFAAEWEQIMTNPNTYAHFITSAGVQLVSDYSDYRDGGIFRSQDGGMIWEDCGVEDYWYSKFYETGEYVFAIGSSCRIARSNDKGITWEMLDYSEPLKSYYSPEMLEMTCCYAITELNGSLYIGDFISGIVLRSENYGDTWEETDRESLIINVNGEKILDPVYNLVGYDGKIYSFGLYSVHTLDPAEGVWHELPISSNCMAISVIMDDLLICGRSMPDESPSTSFLLYTDGTSWNTIDRPQTPDNNVRALHSDGNWLFAANSGGPVWYTDNFGDQWQLADGLPELLFPLTLSTDDKYLYTALYSPLPDDLLSGVWRISKEDLGIAGVELPAKENPRLSFTEDSLWSKEVLDEVTIYDLSGKTVGRYKNITSVSLSSFPKGEYIYVVKDGNKRFAGKFVL